MAGVFDELKRRNVIRVGIAYLIAAWLLLQVTDVLVPILSLPAFAARLVFLLLVIGLVVAIILAWAYELTPDGVQRERDVDRSKSVTAVTGRKLDFIIIAMMAAAIVYLITDNYILNKEPPVAASIERSIAVLPFRNRSNVADDAFFIEGMHDDLLTLLSRLKSLDKVISRTSVERYRDTEKSIPDIGKELGVATILEGGVQRAGTQVRINVQLIDTTTDEHIWAQTYQRELTIENLFEIQIDITREIATTLHGVLSAADAAAPHRMPTTSMEAYASFVMGRHELNKRTGESTLLAKAHFEKAIEIDPDYALAYVGLADSYVLHTGYLGIALHETQEARQNAIDSALSLDPASGEAYTNLAQLQQMQGDLVKAERTFLRAIELSPNYATAYHWYSALLGNAGRLLEQETQIRRAVELDPLSPVLVTNLGSAVYELGRQDEAESIWRAGIKSSPDFPGFYRLLSIVRRDDGRLGEALKLLQIAQNLDPSRPRTEAVCNMYVQLGDDITAEQCLTSLQEEYPDEFLFTVAWLNFYRSQFDEGFLHLEKREQQLSQPNARAIIAFNYLLAGHIDSARSVLEESRPELFLSESEISLSLANFDSAIAVAEILFSTGERDQAIYLSDEVLKFMRLTSGFEFGYFEALMYVIRDDKQLAIQALREAVDRGWRRDWYELRAPIFESMREEQEWLDIISEIEAHVAVQRQWYEEHKDDDLF